MAILDHNGNPFPSTPAYYEKELLKRISGLLLKKFGQRTVFESVFPLLVDHRGRPLQSKKGPKTIKFRRYSQLPSDDAYKEVEFPNGSKALRLKSLEEDNENQINDEVS